ncbi:ABC transporter ATP-binding protein [Pseudooctadecabacter jejudonensis]|uniref:sn-glycerol-3-phosphate import ATP-binding protein UgpC n=1 Tax=Pseudooctadecabacter jejudonensis TaxID=1391910 RepID=A0A1Y5TJE6_9RHOB|nr:sn-glycerol-3-phosphate ABC transporter ATP-binding protein UgpC [Pseudooctadecabacter jejudonensis]SLN63361.1 sn-glycerol-3-phosphate import ATP-binding protein UgpC [Pseudooctadecabacter jejudonensis]
MARVELVNLSKSFGEVKVLHDLNLTVEEGEFVALVGPSGCGKSTLLRIIAGLEDATSGEIVMDNEIVNDLNPRERNIAMVFQSYALYPHMTVEENIGFNLRISGVSKAEKRERARAAAETLGLTDLLDRKPSQLSGGQRQRVAMGRAIVRNPDAFLFDEPLSNLDAKLRAEMRDEIKHLHHKVKTTSIYVTHDQIEAMTLADRVVILKGGVIQQIGTPTELYRNPANSFVAGFIGSPAMNFVDATLETSGGQTTATLQDGTKLVVSVDYAALGRDVKLGLRPEHLELAANSATNAMPGSVRLVEPTGAVNHLKIKVAGQNLTVVDDTLADLALDAPVHLSIAPEYIHVFPKDE